MFRTLSAVNTGELDYLRDIYLNVNFLPSFLDFFCHFRNEIGHYHEKKNIWRIRLDQER